MTLVEEAQVDKDNNDQFQSLRDWKSTCDNDGVFPGLLSGTVVYYTREHGILKTVWIPTISLDKSPNLFECKYLLKITLMIICSNMYLGFFPLMN